MIAWKEEYNTGVELIDEQHRKLLEIANRAHVLLTDDFRMDKYDEIISILGELKEYTVYHFASEEAYMAEIQYSRLLSHKVEHNDFIEKINGVDLEEIDRNHNQSLLKILDFIVAWIDSHIIKKDKLIHG